MAVEHAERAEAPPAWHRQVWLAARWAASCSKFFSSIAGACTGSGSGAGLGAGSSLTAAAYFSSG